MRKRNPYSLPLSFHALSLFIYYSHSPSLSLSSTLCEYNKNAAANAIKLWPHLEKACKKIYVTSEADIRQYILSCCPSTQPLYTSNNTFKACPSPMCQQTHINVYIYVSVCELELVKVLSSFLLKALDKRQLGNYFNFINFCDIFAMKSWPDAEHIN